MKKSEFLQKLESLLANTPHYTAPVSYYLDETELAKEITEFLEQELGISQAEEKYDILNSSGNLLKWEKENEN